MESKKTNLLTILENLERMFEAYRFTVNGVAAKVQSLALATEARALATKVQLMAERWKYKLPFKEACDVEFSLWYKRVCNWRSLLCDSEPIRGQQALPFFEPGNAYFVDMYEHELAKEADGEPERRFYQIADPQEYEDRMDGYIGELDEEDWREQISEAVIDDLGETVGRCSDAAESGEWGESIKQVLRDRSEWLTGVLRAANADYNAFDICLQALDELAESLRDARLVQLNPEDAAFMDLYKRLSASAEVQELQGEATQEVLQWQSTLSRKKRLAELKRKLAKEKGRFFSGKWQEGLENYFDTGESRWAMEGIEAGMFIFRYRRELTKPEVYGILVQCYKLSLYQAFIDKEEKKRTPAPSGVTSVAASVPAVSVSPAVPGTVSVPAVPSVAGTVSVPSVTGTAVSAVRLPEIFSPRLRAHAPAADRLVLVLDEHKDIVGHRSRKVSGGKTWGHVREAFVQMGFVDANCQGAEFGRAISRLCPDRKADNVEAALKRYNARPHRELDANKEQNIVSAIVEWFAPVCSLLSATSVRKA